MATVQFISGSVLFVAGDAVAMNANCCCGEVPPDCDCTTATVVTQYPQSCECIDVEFGATQTMPDAAVLFSGSVGGTNCGTGVDGDVLVVACGTTTKFYKYYSSGPDIGSLKQYSYYEAALAYDETGFLIDLSWHDHIATTDIKPLGTWVTTPLPIEKNNQESRKIVLYTISRTQITKGLRHQLGGTCTVDCNETVTYPNCTGTLSVSQTVTNVDPFVCDVTGIGFTAFFA